MSDKVQVIHGDCREAIKALADGSVDACVTDPPYALTSISKRFGANNAAPAKGNTAYMRASAGFMGQKWDNGEAAFSADFWREVYRVLKPGAHVVAFAGTRTYHRLACAIEDAGFEIRDQIGWLYGSGFPKSHDVSKGIDKAAGEERKVVGAVRSGIARRARNGGEIVGGVCDENKKTSPITEPATAASAAWEGWGTALKPAWEPICLARKPLDGTVAANVLQHGTGALNIDGCRIVVEDADYTRNCSGDRGHAGTREGDDETATNMRMGGGSAASGRWPANIVHDGSADVLAAFPDEAGAFAPVHGTEPSNAITNVYGARERTATVHHGDSGSAARFFYTAKADSDDRMGSKHPTVKPINLMRWLVRMVAPKGALVLDPFAGTGTTGIAAISEGCRAILIEREASFVADIRTRLEHAAGRGKLTAQVKTRNKTTTAAPVPLFPDEVAS